MIDGDVEHRETLASSIICWFHIECFNENVSLDDRALLESLHELHL